MTRWSVTRRDARAEVAACDCYGDGEQPHAETLEASSHQQPEEVPRECRHDQSNENDAERDEDDTPLKTTVSQATHNGCREGAREQS